MNYIELIAKYYPEIKVYSFGDASDYSTLVFSGSVVTQVDLNTAMIVSHATDKIISFGALAKTEIENGFGSSALGSLHGYDSEQEDQLNLIGAVASGTDMNYSCRPSIDGSTWNTVEKEYKLHTNAQLLTVINDGAAVKLGTLQNFNTKKIAILACASIADIDLITW